MFSLIKSLFPGIEYLIVTNLVLIKDKALKNDAERGSSSENRVH